MVELVSKRNALFHFHPEFAKQTRTTVGVCGILAATFKLFRHEVGKSGK